MKTKLSFFVICILFTSFSVYAQKGKGMERIQAQRVAYITNELSLTPAESEKFWPVYKEYKQKVHQLNQSQRPSKPIEQMSDAEKTSFINTMLDNEIKAAEIKRDYYVSFQKILPVAKVAKLEMAERSFKKELIGKMAGEKRRR
ncbi:MAG: hypothetical protein UZ08_BCD001002943 [Candidatus Parvibacillus calidus]|nr:MAG: hypothetical protein UZ08_BCD001002943 [Candidatus Parvibacillus calidus]